MWSKTIKRKYFSKLDILHAPLPKSIYSGYWKNIFKSSKYLKDTYFWIVGNGSRINVWYDKWIDNLIIADCVTDIPSPFQNLRVKDIINKNNNS